MSKINKIGLGTVQFGLDYGISNKDGKVPENDIREILRTAWDSGVRLLDTAAAYGSSEEVLGRTMEPNHRFNIVTKVPKIDERFKPDEIGPFIRKTFEESLRKLNRDSVYGLMFHDAEDLLSEDAEDAWGTLISLKHERLIEKIGVSAYSQEQLETIRKRFEPDLVQVPVNILDQRLVRSGYLDDLHGAGVEIHARSVFLQGLLLLNPKELKPFFDPVKPVLREFHAEAERIGIDPINLALTYVYGLNTISTLVVGVAGKRDINEILSSVKQKICVDFERFAINNEVFINPSLWKIK